MVARSPGPAAQRPEDPRSERVAEVEELVPRVALRLVVGLALAVPVHQVALRPAGLALAASEGAAELARRVVRRVVDKRAVAQALVGSRPLVGRRVARQEPTGTRSATRPFQALAVARAPP
jgi:hypothetical protein